MQTCTGGKKKKKKKKRAVALPASPEVGKGEGPSELPGPPSERRGGAAVASLPVVLVALPQVSLADVPVDDLVHCNTMEKVEMGLFDT